jgi:2',3'-cyclic-nucleotide 2'-phosphodiesterase (5'-nucleotidase family)/predicted AlkP superfamily phosphohydrolase/phosphomutase
MIGSRYPAFLFAFALSILLAAPSSLFPGAVDAQDATPVASDVGGGPVLLFNAAGMRRDLVETFAADGALPAIAHVLAEGASADGGLAAPVPATSGTVQATLLTGTWPAEHGVVGDRFYRTGSPDFANFSTWADPGLIQTDTLPQAAERAGMQVVSVGWEGLSALDPPLGGPVVAGPLPYSQSGVVTNSDPADEAGNAERLGVGYDHVDLRPAEGWSEPPESFSPAQETQFTIRSLDPSGPNPDREFAVYIYDSTDDATTNYDRVLVAPEKNAADSLADLAAGAWTGVPVALTGERDGQVAGFWLKTIDLTPDLSAFRLYYTAVSRVSASWSACGDRPECTEPGGFEESLNIAVGAPVAVDSEPLEAGLIDEATFVAQGITGSWQTVDALRYIVEDLGVRPDLLLLSTSFPDAMSRQFLGLLAAPGAGDAIATPVAEGVASEGFESVDADEVEGFVREGYMMADDILAVGRDLLGPEATTLLASSWGLTPSRLAVNASKVLVDAGIADGPQPENCVPGPVTTPSGTPDLEALPVGPAVKVCWSGGTANIYINLDGREAAGSVAEEAYESTRDAIIAVFEQLRDPANPDEPVVAGIFRKEELRDVSGVDALHPSRTGDVVITLAPPYRFDESIEGAVAEVMPVLAGGYLPVDGSENNDLFLAAGPNIGSGALVTARSIDVAPTAAYVLDVPGPYNASGSILYDILANGSRLHEVTLLDISDFHGQLPPLSAAADDIDAEGAVSSSFDVGGVAFLAPWFDRYRAEAQGEPLLVTAGDAVGATPPISSVFGDLPTIEAMNALGFSADSLGNHNFDAGAANMFEKLAPAANFPYLSVNLVPARADATPVSGDPPFLPSLLLDLAGVHVGIIGFSNPDIPQLTRPGALGPYRVIDPVEPINTEAARLREQGADVIVAMGHIGATGGTLIDPTGPVVEVTDQLHGVDVVVGDHTDVQVSAVRPNGTLLVENRSKGVMFTRVRLVFDTELGELAYRTADHHRPWNIGVTPDPEMAAVLEQLEVDLAPTLGRVIGSAVQPIPRADACGMETGRTCESLIGNVIADALRTTYGTDFAITNSGGIRADLTCPPEGGDFCPTDAAEIPITEGQVLTVLPFGNVAVTVQVNGAELKAMLEAGVAAMPAASGAFPQVSGFCFTYDIEAEPGNRVIGAMRQAADGTCSGEAIDLSEAATYTIATNDFTASGGDNYPMVISRAATRDLLASVVSAYVAGESPLSLPGEPLDPEIEGRIVCEGEGCPAAAGG